MHVFKYADSRTLKLRLHINFLITFKIIAQCNCFYCKAAYFIYFAHKLILISAFKFFYPYIFNEVLIFGRRTLACFYHTCAKNLWAKCDCNCGSHETATLQLRAYK